MKINIKKILFVIFVFVFLIFKMQDSLYAEIKQNKYALKALAQIEDNFTTIAKDVGKAVVGISTQKNKHVSSYFRNYGNEIFNEFFNNFFFDKPDDNDEERVGLGSGVIISKDGYILTNEHIIAGADKIFVNLADGREFVAKLIGSDYRVDLAVIKINANLLPFAQLGDSDTIKPGHWAIAIGNPYSFAYSSSKPNINLGIISALNRALPSANRKDRAYLDLIQTDAGINPANSGGPLLNIYGDIIGINVAILDRQVGYNGLGFAIPINDGKTLLDSLLRGEKVLSKWVGVEVQDITYVLAENFEMKKAQGVLITKVLEESAALESGLRKKDIIIKFNSEKVENSLDFMNKISRAQSNDVIKLKIIRGSIKRQIKLRLNSMPKDVQLDLAQPKKRRKQTNRKREYFKNSNNENDSVETIAGRIKLWRGMKVAEITKEFAHNFEIDSDSGVIVTKVISGSPAESAGIKVKDIIVQINTLNINTLEDYLFAISKASGKVLIKTDNAFLMIQE